MQREFAREKRKLESNNKKIQRDIKKMLKKGEPRVIYYDSNIQYLLVKYKNCSIGISQKHQFY